MNATHRQARLIEALLDPGRYPHPVERVERIETHVSTVLLAGEFAYKIKKPVDLGFLDFRTLEQRAFFCAEEVRLNRRLAPDIYLGRIPITGSCEAPVLGGEGAAIEYAVQMRRFPAGALLLDHLERQALPLAVMDQLARLIADFHVSAERAPAGSGYGEPKQVAAPIWDSLRDLQVLWGPAKASQLAGLEQWLTTEQTRLEPLFWTRRQDGFVRECHGDLHLRNLVWWDDRLLAFDCLEFDAGLRWTDVMSDLAFTLMDLEHRAAGAHANRLKSAYLECGGDYGGLGVLRFYQFYRALVRAKIATLRVRQLQEGTAEHAGQMQEAASYLALAEHYTRPRQPRLVLTCGLSGSGKSTLAQVLVEACGFVRIRSDVERKRLFGLSPSERAAAAAGEGIYSRDASEITYRQLAELARTALAAGDSVVVDAAFLKQEQRQAFYELAAALQIPVDVLLADAAPEVLQARVLARQAAGSDPSDAGPTVLAYQQQTVEWPAAGECRLIRVATDAPDWREQLLRAFS